MGSIIEPTGDSGLVKVMVERIAGTASHAEALRTLRAAFPETPLAARVAALELLKTFDGCSPIPGLREIRA
jgi:hypothetical protein